MQVAFIYSIAGLLMLRIAMQKLIEKVGSRPVDWVFGDTLVPSFTDQQRIF